MIALGAFGFMYIKGRAINSLVKAPHKVQSNLPKAKSEIDAMLKGVKNEDLPRINLKVQATQPLSISFKNCFVDLCKAEATLEKQVGKINPDKLITLKAGTIEAQPKSRHDCRVFDEGIIVFLDSEGLIFSQYMDTWRDNYSLSSKGDLDVQNLRIKARTEYQTVADSRTKILDFLEAHPPKLVKNKYVLDPASMKDYKQLVHNYNASIDQFNDDVAVWEGHEYKAVADVLNRIQ